MSRVPHRRRVREERGRRLLFESLEDRRLLAFTDLGAIDGTLYYNLSGGGQEPIAGGTVQLYRDTGSGIYESGLDTFVGADITDVNGYFRFESLAAGIYFVVQPAEPNGYIQPPPTPLVNTVVITPALAAGTTGVTVDHFLGTSQFLTATLPGTPSASGSIADASILGGVRNLSVNSMAGDGLNVVARVNSVGNSRFSYSEEPDSWGTAMALWNGVAETPAVPPTSYGLGGGAGIDLTEGGTIDSFNLNLYRNDLSAVQTITVYTDAAHASSWTITASGSVSIQNIDQRFKFSDFTPTAGSGADFTEVRAISFTVTVAVSDRLAGLDYQSDSLITVGPGVVTTELPYDVNPAINLVKETNGTDNNAAPGVLVPVGSTVTWRYTVTNPGNVALSNVTVTDDRGVTPVYQSGDTNFNNQLDVTETWIYTATGTATANQYTNLGTASGVDVFDEFVSDTDPDNYFGVQPGVNIVKRTNGTDNNSPTGPVVAVGSTVNFTYVVTNTGNVPLANVVVTDDRGVVVSGPAPGGDVDGDGRLDVTETWTYTGSTIATAGPYVNNGTVVGTPVSETGAPIPGANPVTDTDPDHHFGALPGVNIVKRTNGTDNNSPRGPYVPVGSTVVFTYVVTNTGNVPLANVVVTDDRGVVVSGPAPGGDVDGDGRLDVTETWTYTGSTIATAGPYVNNGTVVGTPVSETGTPIPGANPVTDTDPDHHFGALPGVNIVKRTNGTDNNSPRGPYVPVGSTVVFTYVVTNTGNVPLANVVVTDDRGVVVSGPAPGGDVDGDGRLDVTETWTYTGSTIATAGPYVNNGTVVGTPVSETGAPIPGANPVTDTDPDHHFGALPLIQVVKLTNGTDNNTGTGPLVTVGSTVTWTYNVTNPGNVSLRDVTVTDNIAGVNPQPVLVGGFNTGDTDRDNRLDPGETWVYRATGIAVAGQYENVGTVRAIDDSVFEAFPVSDTDPDRYFGVERSPVVVLGPDKHPRTPQDVLVVNSDTGEILSQFPAYGDDYVGGTRVAVADLDGDGTDEIITAPGRNIPPEVRIFTPDGNPVPGFPGFLAYSPGFTGGVQLAVAYVNDDEFPDIITVRSYGAADVAVFLNRYPASPAFVDTPDVAFRAFPVASIGGAVVAAADMGRLDGGEFVNDPDGIAEIVVGAGPGTPAVVTVFDITGAQPVPVESFVPFTAQNPSFKGGVTLDVAPLDDGDTVPDIIVGMGTNGTSRIELWRWDTAGVDFELELLGSIADVFTGSSNNAPVDVAAMDRSGDGLADAIFAVQGPIGTTGEIHRFDITSIEPFIYAQAPALTGFSGPWFIATSKTGGPGVNPSPEPDGQVGSASADVWTNPDNPYDINAEGGVTPLDSLQVINYINENPPENPIPPAQQFSPPRYFDSTADDLITARDVLVVVNFLNGLVNAAGEGEMSDAGDLAVQPTSLVVLPCLSPSPLRSPSPTSAARHDQVLATFDSAVRDEVEWLLPSDEEQETPPVVSDSPAPRPAASDLGLSDLEPVLEEIAADIAAPTLSI